MPTLSLFKINHAIELFVTAALMADGEFSPGYCAGHFLYSESQTLSGFCLS
jgi:hypothetical protein